MDMNILIDLILIVTSWCVFFLLGYVKGSWDQADKADEQFSDILVQHVQEMDKLKKQLDEYEGEGWRE